MKSNSKKKMNRVFLIGFLVLTVLCWCPLGYGSYGQVPMIMGMPSWAFYLLLIGAVLFVLEWIYLFMTDLALYDSELEGIIAALRESDNRQVVEEEV